MCTGKMDATSARASEHPAPAMHLLHARPCHQKHQHWSQLFAASAEYLLCCSHQHWMPVSDDTQQILHQLVHVLLHRPPDIVNAHWRRRWALFVPRRFRCRCFSERTQHLALHGPAPPCPPMRTSQAYTVSSMLAAGPPAHFANLRRASGDRAGPLS